MVKVELATDTLSVLIAGLYCTFNHIDSMAIPQSVYLEIAEKLEPYLMEWDYEKISFEDWIENNLLILPRILLDDDTVNEMINDTVYWERDNGNVVLSISMNMM